MAACAKAKSYIHMNDSDFDILQLSAGQMRLSLLPRQGGAIHGWTHGTMPLLRPTRPGANGTTTVRETASYPLIPFSNRIAGGRFSFAGKDYVIPCDERDPRHALHGNALYAPWEILKASQDHALLHLAYEPTRHDTPFFPFLYDAEQSYEITETSLRITLRLKNTDISAFPGGLGHHLYFSRLAQTIIHFQAAAMWESDAHNLPQTRTQKWRRPLADGMALNNTAFDNCFEKWNSRADIIYPEAGYRLSITASPLFGHAVLFTPPGKDYFAFEPVTHLNNAINRNEPFVQTGLKILAPGETMEGWIDLHFSKL